MSTPRRMFAGMLQASTLDGVATEAARRKVSRVAYLEGCAIVQLRPETSLEEAIEEARSAAAQALSEGQSNGREAARKGRRQKP